MICFAASAPLLASWAAQVLGRRIDREHTLHERIRAARLHLGVVRPAQLHHHDRLVGIRGLPLFGHLGTHRKRDTRLVAARHRHAAVAQRAEERRQDDALAQHLLHRRRHRLIVPDVQRRRIDALGHDLVHIRRHRRRIRLAVEDEHLSAVLLFGVLLRFGRLPLVEHVRHVRHKKRNLLRLVRRRLVVRRRRRGRRLSRLNRRSLSRLRSRRLGCGNWRCRRGAGR